MAMTDDDTTLILRQLRDYDRCFAEFLQPSGNGQKIMQAILLREAFHRFAQQQVGIRAEAATAILDVSCGPGDYSVAWTSQIARFLPKGMVFYCTDYPGGVSDETGRTYSATTAAKIAAAAEQGRLALARPPVATDADLFAGEDQLMPSGDAADILHWSHSGYHVRDALGAQRDDPRSLATAFERAVDKMWMVLDRGGLMISIHQTADASDGVPSQMLPVSRRYCGALDDVPQRIEVRVRELAGYAAVVNFASPLVFPALDDAGWAALVRPKEWARLDHSQARALRLLNFIALDFSDPERSSLEVLAATGRLEAYCGEFKAIIAANGGHIIVKCAFQMLAKTEAVAAKLSGIASQLRAHMPDYRREMLAGMRQ
jgi:SAM-dependent methyltransferase